MAPKPASTNQNRSIFESIKDGASIPERATKSAAAFDIRAFFSEGEEIQCYTAANAPIKKTAKSMIVDDAFCIGIALQRGETALIPTGIKANLKEDEWLMVAPRSGLSLKTGLRIANAPGVIDADYNQEIFIILQNTSEVQQAVEHGLRIAQLIPMSMHTITHQAEGNAEREGGFGSTGK